MDKFRGVWGWVFGGLVALLLLLAGVFLLWAPERQEPVAAVKELPEAVPEVAVSEVAVSPEAEPAPVVPHFDLIRVTPGGDVTVAGGAEPSAEVTVLLDGAEVFSPSDAPQVLTLRAGGVESAEALIVEPIAGPVVASAAVPEVVPGVVEVAPGAVAEVVDPVEASGEAAEAAVDAIEAGREGAGAIVDAAEPGAEAKTVAAAEAAAAVAGGAPEVVEPEAAPGVEAGSGTVAEGGLEAAEGRVAVAEAVADVVMPEAASGAEAEAVEARVAGAEVAADVVMPEVASGAGTEAVAEAAPEVVVEGQVPAQPRVLRSGPDGVQVVQGRAPVAPPLSIDAISYDDAGEVALSGRGRGDGDLRIYLNNQPVGTASIGADGQWRAPLPEVETGVYTLRVDAIDAAGEVRARVETPFKREEPELLQAASEDARGPLTAITVQPGHTLWAIARDRYGDGVLYVKVFEANRDQIRDPHWIYPGQVFTLPAEE